MRYLWDWFNWGICVYMMSRMIDRSVNGCPCLFLWAGGMIDRSHIRSGVASDLWSVGLHQNQIFPLLEYAGKQGCSMKPDYS